MNGDVLKQSDFLIVTVQSAVMRWTVVKTVVRRVETLGHLTVQARFS